MSFQNKVRFQFWVYPETMREVEHHYKNDNCKSQSEFIEKMLLLRKSKKISFQKF